MSEFKGTKGPWRAYRDDYHEVWSVEAGDTIADLWRMDEETHSRDPLQEEEAEANAQLIAEAGTVLHETGLRPRELVERVGQMMALLKRVHFASSKLSWERGETEAEVAQDIDEYLGGILGPIWDLPQKAKAMESIDEEATPQ